MITDTQKIERHLGIGGSDIAVILGISSYKTPYQLYLEKKQIVQPSMEETSFQYWGNQLEDVIRSEFSKRNNVAIETPTETFIHPFYDFIRGHIDGFIPEWNAVFEAKCASQFMANYWGEDGSDIIPMEYLAQVALYCSILNCNEAHIAVLIGGNDYRQYKYLRDFDLEERIIKAACDFWHAVLHDVPPPATNLIDLKIMFPRHNPEKILTVNKEIEEQLTVLSKTRFKIKALNEVEEQYKFNIMQFMQDAECLTDQQGTPLISWKTNKKGQRTFVVKEIKNDKLLVQNNEDQQPI